MTEHRLDPLLQPASIALLGASERADSPGHVLARMVIEAEYSGKIFPLNPGYDTILGLPCYPDLAALPETVEHVVIALGNPHLESALQAVIEHGAQAVTIYSSGVLDDDSEPPLKQRLTRLARDAGLLICGINGMGFYNLEQQLYAGIFQRPGDISQGGVSYIAQSGSAFTSLCHGGNRLGFNLCVSAGDEMTVTVADYVDWCLERDSTRVIGLFLETVRDPRGFCAVLQKANRRGVPIVVLKIGKSALAASMAVTHTGAIAGDYAVFQALCRRFGVIEVDDLDELSATLMLLQHAGDVAKGDFAAIFESGGFRELMTDIATSIGLEYATLEDHTVSELTRHLDPGLAAENPLDAWGSFDGFESRFEGCLRAMMADPNVAAAAFFNNYRDGYFLSEAIYRVVEKISRESGKLIALGTCYSDLDNRAICQRAFDNGIALLDGSRETLLAFRHLFSWRDFCRSYESGGNNADAPGDASAAWSTRLEARRGETLDEHEALALLDDFAIPTVRRELIACEKDLLAAADSLGYPLVLKTAAPGIHHKSDHAGVILSIETEVELLRHYRDFNKRLGPQALLAQMAGAGVEVALGMVNDAQFGPVVMVASGGILVELFDDREMAMCPLNATQAEAMLASLKLDRLLKGVRGKPAIDRDALVSAIVQLSRLAYELREQVAEIDINPVIASADGALAVDALIQCRPSKP